MSPAEKPAPPLLATPVKSADRVLTILELFATDPTPRTYTEILQATGLPKSSLHGLLATLAARSWLTETRPGPAYTLGIRALEAGAAYMRAGGPTGVTQVLDDLASSLGEAVNLGTVQEQDVVYLAVRRSSHALGMRSAVGIRIPVHASAMGKALLALESDESIRERLTGPMVPLARNTFTEIEPLLGDLGQVRARGYAIEREEATDGIGCIAVSVEPPADRGPLALSVSFPLTRHSAETEQQIVVALEKARAQLINALTIDPGVEIS